MQGRTACLRLLRLFVAALTLTILRTAPALADDAADAKMHYQKATAHYAVGEYKEAAAEYEAAYKSKQDPALLYNAAQSHRLANDNQKALLLYKNIVKLYPTSKYAAESKDRIEKLEQAIATTQSPPNQPAPVEVSPPPAGAAPVQPIAQPAPTAAPPPAAAPPPSSSPAPSATVTATAPPPAESTPIYKEWWFWAGAGAVVAGAVVAAVVLSSSTTAWNNLPDVKGEVR
jgi:tetratricopeptide (TPR) repeat protein